MLDMFDLFYLYAGSILTNLGTSGYRLRAVVEDDFRTISWKPSRAAQVWRMLRQMTSLYGNCKGWKLLAGTTDGNHSAAHQLSSQYFKCISNLNVIVLLLALYYLNLVESLDLEDLEKTTDEHRFSQTDSEVVARQEGSEQAGVAPAVVHNR